MRNPTRFVSLSLAQALALAACASDMLPPDAAEPDAHRLPDAAMDEPPDAAASPDTHAPDAREPVDVGRPCPAPLTLTPDEAWAEPGALVTFSIEGGSGSVRFELAEDASGARIEETLGIYSAGTTEGTEDLVRVVDQGCDASAMARVHVVGPLALSPSVVEVVPMGTVAFEATGGSGERDYELVRNGSSGTVDDTGRYMAGMTPGRDRVRVTDRRTGATAEASITVDPGAASLRPIAGTMGIPEGALFALAVTGGSGRIEARSADDTIARVVDGNVEGLSPGATTISVSDRFTGAAASIAVQVLEAAGGGTIDRVGDMVELHAIASGDVDGDGFADLALGQVDNDLAGQEAGSVSFYRGTATGLSEMPTRVITGERRGHRMGTSVLLVDATGDGRIDLLAGAGRGDGAAVSSGTVSLFPGGGDGTFASEASRVFTGPLASDELGSSMVACDFNDDGRVDLAFGAPEAEDRTLIPQQASQGAIHVYLARSGGAYPLAADLVLYGAIPVPETPGTFAARGATRLGTELAAGDVDGDGVCDLVAHMRSPWAGMTPRRDDDGAVLVFRGVAADPGMRRLGGLERSPSRFVAGAARDATTPGSRFGIALAVADLDADGRAEIVAGQSTEDFPMRTDAGAVRVLAGGLPSPPPADAELAAAAAAVTLEGALASGQTGREVVVSDMNGDGRLDLVVATPVGELTGMPAPPTDTGLVQVHVQTSTPLAFEAGPTHAGLAAGDRLGMLVEPLTDLDGDGLRELAAYAWLDDADGVDVGALHVLPSAMPPMRSRAAIPGTPSGARLGRGLDVVGDVLGADGFPELAAGCEACDRIAPLSAFSRSTGRVFLYRGTARGFDLGSPITIEGFVGHAGGDALGNGIARIGRFDGADTIDDFAVIARNGDRAATLPAGMISSAGTSTCGGALNNAGAVHVFRGVATTDGLTRPAFTFYLPFAGQTVESVTGGLDLNGDGFDDLVVGTRLADPASRTDAGAFAVIFGGRRADSMGRTIVLCAADLVREGDVANMQLGASLAGIPDVNGDGCDELAVGARNLTLPGAAVTGAVDVVFGWRRMTDTASPTCPTSPEVVRLSPSLANSLAGSAVAGGDADGDGLGDLLIGAPGHRSGALTVGRAYLVTGAYLASIRSATGVQRLASGSDPPIFLEGLGARDALGTSVAFVPGVSSGGRDGVAFSAPEDDLTGARLSGSVRVHRVALEGGVRIEPTALAVMGGETARPSSAHGEVVRAFRTATHVHVVVGAPVASALSSDWGASYVLSLPR